MEEFIKREGGDDGRLKIPADQWDAVNGAAQVCDRRAKGGKHTFNGPVTPSDSSQCSPIHCCVLCQVNAVTRSSTILQRLAIRRISGRMTIVWSLMWTLLRVRPSVLRTKQL